MARRSFARYLPYVPLLIAVACGGPGEPAGEQPDAQEAPVDGGTAVVAETADFDAFNDMWTSPELDPGSDELRFFTNAALSCTPGLGG